MRVAVLGPIEVRDASSQLVRVPRARARALLAALVLEQGHTVSRDRLSDVLWGDRPPPAASTSLNSYISQLRRVLGEGAAIVGDAAGYRLEIPSEVVDANRFEDLAAAGRAALAQGDFEAADDRFGEALELWRGRPYGEFADEGPFRAEADRLTEARLAVLEDRLDVQLARGRHAAVVGEAESLLVDFPLRERLWARLMVALCRCGRQAEALAAYQRVRKTLVEELGLEPGTELRELEQRILAQDPTLDHRPQVAIEAATAIRPNQPVPTTVLVGRQAELSQAAQALGDVAAGRGRVLVVAGEAGIGKTTLCDRIAADAAARGFLVVLGRCVEGEGAPPLWPWIQVLRGLAEQLHSDQLRLDVIGPGAGDLAALEPRIGPVLGNPAVPPVAEEGVRFRQFDAVTCLLQEAARTQPVAVVIDDLHRADAASALLVSFLARGIARDPILLVTAHRDEPAERTDALRDTLGELTRLGATARVGLTGLNREEVAVLIASRRGSRPAQDLTTAVHRHCEGNPFYISEVVRSLGDHDPSDIEAILPASIRDVVVARARRLPAPAQHALRAAAVLGRRFDTRTLELMTELEPDELAVAIDDAVAANFVAIEAVGHWRFVHALVAEALCAELSPRHCADLHRRAAHAIAEAHVHDLNLHLAELAHHHQVAAAPGDGGDAVRYSLLAGEFAASHYAYEEACAHYQRALDALERDPPIDPQQRAAILVRLGEASRDLGHYDVAEHVLIAAATAAATVGDTDLQARAVLAVNWIGEQGVVYPHRVAVFEELLACISTTDSVTRARALTGLVSELVFGPDFARRRALSSEAVAMARRLGDRDLLAECLALAAWGSLGRDHFDEALELGAECRVLLGEGAAIESDIRNSFTLMFELLSGRATIDTVDAEIERCARFAAERRLPWWTWMELNLRTMRAILTGDLTGALELFSRLGRAGQLVTNPNIRITSQGHLHHLGMEYGYPIGSELPLVELVDTTHIGVPLHAVLAFVYTVQGRMDEATALLAPIAPDGFAALAADMYWVPASIYAAAACARVGNRAWAATWYDQLMPHADRCVATMAPAAWYGSCSWVLGDLAALLERWDEADTHFAHALRVHERMDAQPWIVRIKVSWADMLEHRRHPGDAERAAQLYTQAQAIVDRFDLPRVDWRPSAKRPTL